MSPARRALLALVARVRGLGREWTARHSEDCADDLERLGYGEPEARELLLALPTAEVLRAAPPLEGGSPVLPDVGPADPSAWLAARSKRLWQLALGRPDLSDEVRASYRSQALALEHAAGDLGRTSP